jgi:L-malate glycosyltransferase
VWLLTFKDGPQQQLLNNEVHCIVFEKNGYLKTAYKLAQFIKANRIDIIHTSLFAPTIITSLATIFKKITVIWHFHSHEYDAPWYSSLAFIICARFGAVKRIFFVNKELEKYLSRRLLLPEKKLGILHNSTSIAYNSTERNNGDIVTIGYTGRIIPIKRVHYLIELVEYLLKNKINNFFITVIGDGEQRPTLEALTHEKGLENHIKFVGFQKDIENYYSRFDVFVNPSSEECLSIALIDAGIKGIPSIAFDVGGNDEIIENGMSGFIVKTKEDMFQKVKLLIEDKNKRSYFCENAKEICLNKFSQQTRRKRLIEITQILQ